MRLIRRMSFLNMVNYSNLFYNTVNSTRRASHGSGPGRVVLFINSFLSKYAISPVRDISLMLIKAIGLNASCTDVDMGVQG